MHSHIIYKLKIILMNSSVRNKTLLVSQDSLDYSGLPELNPTALRQLDAMTRSSKSTRSTSFGAYCKSSPTRQLFIKNRETLEDMLIRKFKVKYLTKEQLALEAAAANAVDSTVSPGGNRKI